MNVPPIIPALVTRHAGDAAFYWHQHDGSVHSPLLGLNQLLEFDRLLDAHLDGVRAAGDAGWGIALAQLERWASAAEVFVCVTLALESADPSPHMSRVWAVIQKNPERMLRGLIAAMAWAPAQLTAPWCTQWLRAEMPAALAVVAWRVRAIRSGGMEPEFTTALPQALSSKVPAVRAASARAAARMDPALLEPLLEDADLQVRAEAAIALTRLPRARSGLSEQQHSHAAYVLWQATQALGEQLQGLTGWYRSQAQHRLLRWACHLGLVAPLGHPAMAQLLDLLPTRLGLWFVLHHGDGHYLPWVVQRMSDPEVARLAGWVWSAFTGVDLHNQGLALPPRGPAQEPRTTDIQDPGLLEPDAGRIQAFGLTLPSHVVSLQGRPVDDLLFNQLLWHAPQALRWIAAQRQAMAAPAAAEVFNTRAHGLLQRGQLPPLPEAQAA